MKFQDIIKDARAASPAAFGKVSDKRAAKILRAAFAQVNSQIQSTDNGNVTVQGLGRFAVRNFVREKDGAKVSKRRVTFNPRESK